MTNLTGDQQAASCPLVANQSIQRLVEKDGRSVKRGHGPGYRETWRGAMWDMWGTWLALRWRWVVLAFCGSFLLHWLLFALLWYLLAHVNGDLNISDHDNAPEDHVLCVKYVNSFTAAFSFALETQLTIGYGTMYPNADCPTAIALLAVQMLLGLMLEAFITGAFVAKFSRPRKRCCGILFSQESVICEVKGQSCLMFRVCNLLPSPLVDLNVSAVLYEESDDHVLHQSSIEFTVDNLGSKPCPLFLSPLIFCHPLTSSSPLKHALASQSHFELVVFLTASQECTGTSFSKRTSYLRNEIVQGKRFTKLTSLFRKGQSMKECMRLFETESCSLPLPSTTSNNTQENCVVVQINVEGNDKEE